MNSNFTIDTAYSEVIETLQKSPLRDNFAGDIQGLKERYQSVKKNDVRIGVIGVTSSGKSTLINAFLGEALLPMYGRPSSSQLVSCRKAKERKAIIVFSDGKTKELTGNMLSARNLEAFCDEENNKANKKQVRHIYLYSPKFDFPENVVLVDSPGLDAYGLQNHEKLTMETLLPTVDLCLFVTTCKSNSDQKTTECFDTFAYHNKKVIVVQNMADSISATEYKTYNEVAADHIKKVRNCVEKSDIKDKKSVSIIQISARNALLYLTGKLDINSFKKSNFTVLLKNIKAALEDNKPYITNGKIKILKQYLTEKIIAKCDDTIKDLNNALKGIKIKPSEDNTIVNYNKKIEELDDYQKKEGDIIRGLVSRHIKDVQKYIERNDIYQRQLDKINVDMNNIIELVIQRRRRIQIFYESQLRELSLDIRDAFGDIYIPPLFNNSIQSKEVEWIEERCCASDKVHSYTDTDENQRKALEMLENLRYSLELAGNQIKSQVNVIHEKLVSELRRRIHDAEEQNKLRESMQNDLANINYNRYCYYVVKQALVDINDKLRLQSIVKRAKDDIISRRGMVKMNIVPNYYFLYKLAKSMLKYMNMSVTSNFIEQISTFKSSNMIIGWDEESLKRFCFNCFDVDLHDETNLMNQITIYELNLNGETIVDDYAIMWLAPNTLDSYKKSYDNLFVLVNMTQIGQAKTQLSKIGIEKVNCKNIIFVVQDFDECSDNLEEYMPELRGDMARILGIKQRTYFLFNDRNPLLNLAAINLQLGYITNQTDETEFIDALNRHYASLYSPRIRECLPMVIRTSNMKQR